MKAKTSTLVAVSLAVCFGVAQLAQAETVQVTTYPAATVTETTTTITKPVTGTTVVTTPVVEKTTIVSGPVTLPTTSSYIVVHPSRGLVTGSFDVATRMIDGRPLESGMYIVEKSSGKVYATVDASGNLVSFTAAPTATLGERFVVLGTNVFYYTDDVALRTAKLEAQITAAHADGKLSHEHLKDLKSELNQIQALAAKRNKKGELSSSTKKKIEIKFANVQEDLADDLAKISKRRANIGIVTE